MKIHTKGAGEVRLDLDSIVALERSGPYNTRIQTTVFNLGFVVQGEPSVVAERLRQLEKYGSLERSKK